MPAPLELLYDFSPRDTLVGDYWGPKFYDASKTNQAAALVQAEPYVFPRDKTTFVNSLWIEIAVAAGFAGGYRVRLVTPAGDPLHFLYRHIWEPPPAVGNSISHFLNCDWAFVGGTHRLDVEWVMSAGNVGNVYRWGFGSYECAKGNVVLR